MTPKGESAYSSSSQCTGSSGLAPEERSFVSQMWCHPHCGSAQAVALRSLPYPTPLKGRWD